jgi:hypothetical protein
MRFWTKAEKPEPPPIYVGSYEDRLRRIAPLHFSPDDEGHTREDQARAEAYDRADRWPFAGWSEWRGQRRRQA